MAICPYCGYSTGIFRKVHRVCRSKYELGKDIKDYSEQLKQTNVDPVLRDEAIFDKVKTGAIISLALGFIILGIAQVTVDKSSFAGQIAKYLFAVLLITSSYIWCTFDTQNSDYRLGKYMLLVFILMLPLALVIHFYRSRGFKKGSIGLLKAGGLFLLLLIVGAISAVIARRLLGITIH